ncbi:efflux RND transporter permease subunit [bacterium]|nr:efflux RND transporter permease subunit [bacterium]MBU1024429.1 efflux RND transporter permease subunit [bacterium]
MRAFSDFFIDRPRIVTMILIFLTVVGITALTTLPKEATPDIVIPMSFVQVVYPGVSPEDIEQEVTNKIESALEQLKDVDYISSYVSEGMSVTFVNFLAGTDIDEKVRETREEVATVRSELPDDIEEPVVYDWSFTDSPVMVIAITSDQGIGELTNLAQDLEDKLEKISGVSQVDIVGTLDKEVHVNFDPAKLSLYNISLSDITSTIRRENFNIPVGTSSVGTNKFVMRSMGKFESLDDLASVVLSANQGRIVTLSDVARVEFTTEDRDSYARINGKECLNLIVTKKSGENLLKTVDLVKKGMENFSKDFPSGSEYRFIGDKSWTVRKSNTNLFQNLGWGLLLVFLVLLIFLGWQSSVIITPTIPWSIFCGYLFLWWQGYSINNVVTFGAIIVLGMLVDDAIIVTENTMRHLEMGEDNDTAARAGIHEVGGAILAAGLTTFAAFGPMLFMPGITGQFIKFIPIMVISSLAGAIFIAHGFTPVFCKYFLKAEKYENANGKPQGGWLKSLLPGYKKILKVTLKHPFATLAIAWLLFFVAIGIVASGMLQFELFPNSPYYKFILDYYCPVKIM